MRSGIYPVMDTSITSLKDGKQTSEKAIQVTEHFIQTSGIHGIGHIRRGSKPGGIVWAVICLTSFGNLTFLYLEINFEN